MTSLTFLVVVPNFTCNTLTNLTRDVAMRRIYNEFASRRGAKPLS